MKRRAVSSTWGRCAFKFQANHRKEHRTIDTKDQASMLIVHGLQYMYFNSTHRTRHKILSQPVKRRINLDKWFKSYQYIELQHLCLSPKPPGPQTPDPRTPSGPPIVPQTTPFRTPGRPVASAPLQHPWAARAGVHYLGHQVHVHPTRLNKTLRYCKVNTNLSSIEREVKTFNFLPILSKRLERSLLYSEQVHKK